MTEELPYPHNFKSDNGAGGCLRCGMGPGMPYHFDEEKKMPNLGEIDPIYQNYLIDKLRDRGYPGLSTTKSNAEQVMAVTNEPAVWVERIANDTVTYEIKNIPNDQALRIILRTLPKVIEMWMKKSKDYGGTSGGLGPKAPFVDIWRKVIKLKRSLWEDEALGFEQTDELLADLVGTSINVLDEIRTDRRCDDIDVLQK